MSAMENINKIADKLTVILGTSEMLVSGAFGPLNDRQGQAVEEILSATRELCELIRPARSVR